MKKFFFFLITITVFGNNTIAQVPQFPQIYYSAQGTSGQNIRTTPSLTGNSVISVMLSKIGAESLSSVTMTPYSVQNWIKVCLPGTTGNINYGYMLCSEFYARINELNNYATVTATSLNIRTCAGCTTTNVTIGTPGVNAMYGQNSIVALTTGNSVSGWYEVYLPNNCSQPTGWVSGTFLTFNSLPSNYRNVGGRICNDASSCAYLGAIGGAVVTLGSYGSTYSSGEGGGNAGGFYEYKLPINANATITCTHPNYTTSNPASYSYTASSHNYTKNFVLSNSTNYTISGTITNSATSAAMSGVTVNATGLTSTTTNSSGYYSFSVTSGYSGTVTPSLSGFTFSPPSRPFSNVTTNQTNQNFSGTGSAYTISGTITNSATSAAMSGVTVNATGLSASTTNSSGFYTFNVSSGYSGTVTPSLSGFTFSPTSRPFSNVTTNQTSQNFSGTPASTITITSSVIPPWQRFGDSFTGSITVNLSNAGTNPQWHIEADAFNKNGTYVGNVNIGMGTTTNTISFSSSQVSSYINEGWHFNWNAVLESNNYVATASQQTNIIEKKWDKKNIVYYNEISQQLLIPLRYFSNTISVGISFSRISGTSTYTNNILNTPHVSIGNEEYMVIEQSNSLIEDARAGTFKYYITYNPSGFFQESGVFDLTKIGHINGGSLSNNNIVVLVGGNVDIEKSIQSLPDQNTSPSILTWSIANNISNEYSKNTWYISCGNISPLQKNAYDIGKALERMAKF